MGTMRNDERLSLPRAFCTAEVRMKLWKAGRVQAVVKVSIAFFVVLNVRDVGL